ncbi:MAG: hypothetical protein DRQ98_14295, partial [Gammaproteobacteria bacterium]
MKTLIKTFIASTILVAGLVQAFTYQGELSQSGVLVTGTPDLKFSLYNSETGGSQVSSVEVFSNVPVSNGRFLVNLDNWSSLLDGTELWLNIAVDLENNGSFTPLTPRQKLAPAPYAEFTYNGGGVSSFSELEGQVSLAQLPDESATDSELSSSIANHDHNTIYYTRDQVGSMLASRDTLIADAQNAITALQSQLAALSGVTADITALQTDIGTLQAEVTPLADLSAVMTVSGDDVIFESVNVHIRNGSGLTRNSNSLGNLIIGYNESDQDVRTGSHNLVMGERNSYTGQSNIISGFNGNASSAFGAIIGGVGGVSDGTAAVVVGGLNNSATGSGSIAIGGNANMATGNYDMAIGGADNQSSGTYSVIFGGINNQALGLYTTIAGGQANVVNGPKGFIGGGAENQINSQSEAATVVGGFQNIGYGSVTTGVGGRNNTPFGSGSVVLGGSSQTSDQDYGVVSPLSVGSNSPLDGIVTVSGNNVIFEGVNVHIRNISGTTDGAPDGTGNLIIGYNETSNGVTKGGSHNLVLGRFNSYDSYGGLVSGVLNHLTDADATALSGGELTVSAGSAAIGGYGNTITASGSTTIGGQGNSITDTGSKSVLVGGNGNVSSNQYGITVGGLNNIASGLLSMVIGGSDNTSPGRFAAVFGGKTNISSGESSTTIGGQSNDAQGDFASISGGSVNIAYGVSSSVSGGSNNASNGDFASVSGGQFGNANGDYSSITGGYSNSANNSNASVTGGALNTASGSNS